eukprot:TRINITY_DN9963_c0_g2_i1.p1 TRINITY_DN9963_c0_g2~~TRINITY_DN9963_c0_g2_i1.p1  ORF type:complete len:192 (+),score=45.18 TRINITY_DN9963_c0_g2_i1:84-659(+)
MGCKSSKGYPEDEWRARRTQQWVKDPHAAPQSEGSWRGGDSGRRYSSHSRGGFEPTSPSAASVHSGVSSVGAPSYESARGFHARAQEAQSLLKKHRDKVPIIFEVQAGADLPPLHNPKMLFASGSDVGHLIVTVRQKMRLPANKTLFITTKAGRTPDLRQKVASLYAANKSDDGFLYLWCSSKKFSAFWWK